MSTRVAILTPVPSPYQVELFNALAQSEEISPQVVYLEHRHPERRWEASIVLHDHVICANGASDCKSAAQFIGESDLSVFSWYASRFARHLMQQRAFSGRPWVYWGEPPGFRRVGWLGKIRRRLLLWPLVRQAVPIWGMGSWAVRSWQAEFGQARPYFNVPYFSDLSRFCTLPRRQLQASSNRRFLYSGSLIARKGVDLLADAFVEVAKSNPNATLAFLGCGPLESFLRRKLAPYISQVQFLGFQPWNQLQTFYQEADFLVAPSRYDGWGLIVPEGLAAGLPVIATDRMGAAIDLVNPGINGWRVAAGDRGALTLAMMEAAQLPVDRLAAMSIEARNSVAQHSLTEGVRRFTSATHAALNGHSAG